MKDRFIQKIIDGINRIIDSEYGDEWWRKRVYVKAYFTRLCEILVSIKVDHYVLVMEAILNYLENAELHYEILSAKNTVIVTLKGDDISLVINAFTETSINASKVLISSKNEVNDELSKESDLKYSFESDELWLFEGNGYVIPHLACTSITLFIMTIVVASGGIALPYWVPTITGVLLIFFSSYLAARVYDKVKNHRSVYSNSKSNFLTSASEDNVKQSNSIDKYASPYLKKAR